MRDDCSDSIGRGICSEVDGECRFIVSEYLGRNKLIFSLLESFVTYSSVHFHFQTAWSRAFSGCRRVVK